MQHVVTALLGMFKGETGVSYHLMLIVAKTDRGLEPRKWIGFQIYDVKELMDHVSGITLVPRLKLEIFRILSKTLRKLDLV